MKGQDILLLFKLLSLEKERQGTDGSPASGATRAGRLLADATKPFGSAAYTVRSLAEATGIGKTEVAQSLARSYSAGLAKLDRTGLPRANAAAVLEFVVHGLRYVFPVQPGALARGFLTGFGAPALRGRLITGGELEWVWPDAQGETRGVSIEPLYKSVPYAARRDACVYEYLALADAIRVGQPRERGLAIEILTESLRS